MRPRQQLRPHMQPQVPRLTPSPLPYLDRLLHQLLLGHLQLLSVQGGGGRVNGAGTYGVDTNVLRAQVHGQAAVEQQEMRTGKYERGKAGEQAEEELRLQ